MKKKWYVMMMLILFTILTGCNNKANTAQNPYAGNEAQTGHYDNKNSTDLLRVDNNHQGEEDRAITTDEISDQNPNLLNLNTGGEHHVNNEGVKLDQAKEVIRKSDDFEGGPLWRNGDELHVTVYPKGDMSGEERKRAQKELKRELMRALPTYSIHINVENR
jgi:hypothetical protein